MGALSLRVQLLALLPPCSSGSMSPYSTSPMLPPLPPLLQAGRLHWGGAD